MNLKNKLAFYFFEQTKFILDCDNDVYKFNNLSKILGESFLKAMRDDELSNNYSEDKIKELFLERFLK